ncbi:hypothetical protein KM043_014436 [Ampulex compressa]|nr:hypothetical protein KM043_014436 [Ampulex compressa]
MKCDYCKEKGHEATECYKSLKAEKQNANATKELFFNDENTHAHADFTFNATLDQKWCLDNGYTSHLCKDSESFTNTQQIKSCIKLVNSTTVLVTAKGDVKITFSNGEQDI